VAAGVKALEKRKRDVVFDGSRFKVPVFDGATLSPDMKINGPAIVEEPTTTVVIPPEWELWVNGFGDYEISK
jgi:N-methylhydantoinase A